MADLTIPEIIEICKDFPNPPSQKILANQQFLVMYRNFAKETLVAKEQEKKREAQQVVKKGERIEKVISILSTPQEVIFEKGSSAQSEGNSVFEKFKPLFDSAENSSQLYWLCIAMYHVFQVAVDVTKEMAEFKGSTWKKDENSRKVVRGINSFTSPLYVLFNTLDQQGGFRRKRLDEKGKEWRSNFRFIIRTQVIKEETVNKVLDFFNSSEEDILKIPARLFEKAALIREQMEAAKEALAQVAEQDMSEIEKLVRRDLAETEKAKKEVLQICSDLDGGEPPSEPGLNGEEVVPQPEA